MTGGPRQVPVLEVFHGVPLHPAAFLSLYLPPTLDALVPPTYTRQVLAQAPEPATPRRGRAAGYHSAMRLQCLS